MALNNALALGLVTGQISDKILATSAAQCNAVMWIPHVFRQNEKHVTKNTWILRSPEKQYTPNPIQAARNPWQSWQLPWKLVLGCSISCKKGVCWEAVRKDGEKNTTYYKAFKWGWMCLSVVSDEPLMFFGGAEISWIKHNHRAGPWSGIFINMMHFAFASRHDKPAYSKTEN